jgi:hypothetical protein
MRGRSRDECRLDYLGHGPNKASLGHQNLRFADGGKAADIASRSAVKPSGQCRGWRVTGHCCAACGLPVPAGGNVQAPSIRTRRASPSPALEIPPRRRLVPEECSVGRRKSGDALRTNSPTDPAILQKRRARVPSRRVGIPLRTTPASVRPEERPHQAWVASPEPPVSQNEKVT